MKSWLSHPKGELPIWLAVLALACVARYLFIFSLHPPERFVFSDMGIYFANAQAIANGTADHRVFFQSGLFSALVALSLKLTGSLAGFKWLHLLLSSLTVLLMGLTARRLWGKYLGLVVLLAAAAHYHFVALSGFVLAETTLAFVISLTVYVGAQGDYRPKQLVLMGLLAAVAVYIKGTAAIFLPLWLVLVGLSSLSWAHFWRAGAFALTGVLVAALLHGTMAKQIAGVWKVSNDAGGLNFLEGKCPWKDNGDGRIRWMSPLFYQLGETGSRTWDRSFSDSNYFFREGLLCIMKDPAVLVTSVRYVYYLFFENDTWPLNATPFRQFSSHYDRVFTVAMWPGIIAGLILVWRGKRRGTGPELVLLAMAMAIMLSAWVFKSEMRYRVPFDTVFIPLGVYGWWWLTCASRKAPVTEKS